MTTKADSASPLDITVMPCPFCGKSTALEVITDADLMDEDQEFWAHSESFSVVCSAAKPNGKGGCGAMCGFSPTEREAIERWNKRPNAKFNGGAAFAPSAAMQGCASGNNEERK